LQEQFVMTVDPGVEEDEAGHKTHALAPAVLEYVPAGHNTHVFTLVAPAAPEYAPAGHETHALELLAPVTPEYAPAEQFVHESTLLAPVTDEYLPARQSEHTAAPAAAYFPAAHATHAPLTLTYPAWHPHRNVSSSKTWPDGHGA
jgi:hypothetical protein